MRDIHEILREYWGYETFRPLQEEIIRAVTGGRDTLALMPTGGGKSLTYQVSGLALGGLTLVVTPLIALMKDQVEDLRRRGVEAEALYMGMRTEDIESVTNKCVYAGVRFLYVSPERLTSARFRERLRQMPVRLIAVDEAHCISQWGYDFRPSYLRIAEAREFFPGVVVLALTATATPAVVEDIQRQLGFAAPNVLSKSFRRENISYVTRETDTKDVELVHILERVKGSAIVYTRTRERARELAGMLNKRGIRADFYHAGLPSATRARKQEEWKRGETPVIVATNAFGMGIDKADVRVVVHVDIPDSPEAYFQEAGRAGRDGRRAYAVLLYNASAVAALKRRVDNEFPAKEMVKRVYEALGNYFQLGEGEGQGRVFEFDEERFCRRFSLEPAKTRSAIDILSLCGYLECTTEINSRARVTFLVPRDELYNRDTSDPLQERLLVTLMRTYAGIFVQDVFVDEDYLAESLGVCRHELYEAFLALAKRRIIRYVPGDDKPYIIYYQPRLPLSYIRLSREVYEKRRESYAGKIRGMVRYVEDRERCRQLQLMEYFGQRETEPCGICDNCLARRKGRRQDGREAARAKVLEVLGREELEMHELAARLDFPREVVTAVTRELLDEGAIRYLDDMKLTSRKNK